MVYKSKYPDCELPQTGIIQFIFSNIRNTPEDKPLLIDAIDDRFITYGQLKDSILKFGAGLQDVCDFKSDDVLALFAPNQYDYSIPFLGALAANGASTTANPNYTVEELVHQLNETKPKVLICHKDNLTVALAAGAQAGILKKNTFIFGDKVVNGVQPFQTALMRERKTFPDELTYEQAKTKTAYLCFSSGTTGKSKGVMTSHANITASTCQYTSSDDKFIDSNTDRIISILPLFHIFGIASVIHTALYWGIPVYILPRFDLALFCETVQKYKITFAPLVPPIYLLLARQDFVLNYDMSSWRIGVSGAALLSAELSREVKARFPNLIIKQGYGLTETSPSITAEPTDRTVDGSIGVLLPNIIAKLVDEEGNEVARGERGELWVKGPNIMKGYINNPEATADCIDEEGYFHTGDVVVVDENEHFFIVDRLKELIKYKGFQVPPAELESILLTFPIITDCAVIGVYDSSQATELPRAYVTVQKDIQPSEEVAKQIMKYVADQVVSYKQLRSVRFIDVIPRSPAGKILRRVLRDVAHEEEKSIISKPRL